MRMTAFTPVNQSTIGCDRLFEMMENPVQSGQTIIIRRTISRKLVNAPIELRSPWRDSPQKTLP
jgi:hypothetical protein